MAGLLTAIIVDNVKSKVIINQRKVSKYGLRPVRQIPLDKIKGYKIKKSYYQGYNKSLILYPDTKEFKVIRISHNFKGFDRIQEWVQKNYPDITEA
ncbi:hypothetical protein AB9P05_23125 [Roseivirga sp. BDSF3-8]|uniref:hypothetical protein n=1 Tax=Roseivirga sp. BDSF3-8 TaxID=3241598 RepID=UPI0035320540